MRRVYIFLGLVALVVWVSGVDSSARARGASPGPRSPTAGAAFPPQEEEQWDPHFECDTNPLVGACLSVPGCGTNVNCDLCVPQVDCSACTWYPGDPWDPEGTWQCGGEVGGPSWDWDCDCCKGRTPIILSLSGSPELSNARRGVPFDIFASGTPVRTPWPRSGDDGWLVLDRNGNGLIENSEELFGNMTRLPDGTRARNGFLALRALDDNRDGRIDASDSAFASLRMWRDTLRDGVTQPGELVPLASVGISSISLDYKTSRRKDRWGNLFLYRARLSFASGRTTWAYDVILEGDTARPR